MKLAFCLTENAQDALLDRRFGRSGYFGIFDTESGGFKGIDNLAKNESGGAGAMAVQLLVDSGIDALIAPEVGPQALDALQQLGIDAYRQGACGTIAAAFEAWNCGSLEKIEKPTVKGLHRA